MFIYLTRMGYKNDSMVISAAPVNINIKIFPLARQLGHV